jgi:DNA-directed RNA polymerase subunit RPC12/RpoP
MMFSSSGDTYNPQYEDLLRDGITAAKNGSRKLAKSLLNQATMMISYDSRPWLWLSATTDDPEEQRRYLERAVAVEPSNAAARRALMMLSEKLDKSRLVEIGAEVLPRQPTEVEDAQASDYLCPKCGGHLQFDVDRVELTCQYCGYTQMMAQNLAADSAEQGIDYILPTTRAHRWAETRQRVACQRCGAITLLDAGQTADRCPYCGSNRLVQPSEASELVEPQVIGLMKVDEQQARKQARDWLGKG